MNNIILNNLNETQKSAVLHTTGPVLVFAGAGSGKTRVLTHRIANLLLNHNVHPYNILAVTFTNKAANEMKERIEQILGHDSKQLWAGTFHGICVRILRENAQTAGISKHFTIYDDYDQLVCIKECMSDMEIDTKEYNPRRILELISKAKERLITPDLFEKYFSGPVESIARRVYIEYQNRLQQNSALDFDDLIMKTVLMLRNDKDVLEHYQNRFEYVLVDEYQDINYSQYQLVSTISDKHKNIFCVGDDDQSIYKWRGADISIILQFEKDYPNATIYKLEQNYRSTKTILNAAYNLVKRNKGRADKKIWTHNDEGEKIIIIDCLHELDEAYRIAEDISKKIAYEQKTYQDFAILYRTNAQSRVFEEAMMKYKIPYKLIGSLKFFDRREVKDIIAYLKLALNPYETLSLKRVINTPSRGIGPSSITKLSEYAKQNGIKLFDALGKLDDIDITAKAKNAMADFYAMIGRFHNMSQIVTVDNLTTEIIERTGYINAMEEEKTMEARSRIENVYELINVTKYFVRDNTDSSLSAFLEQVALISDVDSYDSLDNAVTMMTLHAAKGLEFPIVYIVGLEEGIFPHRRALNDREEMEEERRLCYVGMTRAKEQLIFTYAHQRNQMGQLTTNDPSRFLEEIPANLIAQKPNGKRTADNNWKQEIRTTRPTTASTYKPGQKVVHEKYGKGIVLNSKGEGTNEQVTIAFDNCGIQKLLVAFENLEKN
ncbi:MAG: DNA helicase PcrA [Armatimonadota bacterium]